MATRATIAILKEDNTVQSISLHWDGGLVSAGAKLYEHYKSNEKVQKLISLGNLSSLFEEPEPPAGAKHSNTERYKGVCVYYGRDFPGETIKMNKHRIYENLEEYMMESSFEEFNYLFDEKKSQWFLIDLTLNKLNDLKTAIINDERFSESDIKKYMQIEQLEKNLSSKRPNKTSNKIKI